MVQECWDQSLLSIACKFTRSCAKSSRRGHWINKKGSSGKAPLGCGVCVPCLFRRSALYKGGFDNEVYGIPVEKVDNFEGEARADLLALVAFLRRADSDREIAAGLLGNGSLPLEDMMGYVDLVKRMRAEVVTWLQARGSSFLKKQIQSC